MEVGGVDDERVALPLADRVAEPEPLIRRWVLRIHAHDACVVDHLDEDHHVVLGLHDALEVVVEARKVGAAPVNPSRQRSLMRATRGRRRGPGPRDHPPRGAVVRAPEPGGARQLAASRRRRHRRHAAVGRIDEDRGRELAVDGEGLGAAIDPEPVVAADVAGARSGCRPPGLSSKPTTAAPPSGGASRSASVTPVGLSARRARSFVPAPRPPRG